MSFEGWTPSTLFLSTGEAFPGMSPSWQKGFYFGEAVFATGMTGYVESLTDPSYAGQILTFTYPLIGNYGTLPKNSWESDRIQVAGVVAGYVSEYPSHWNSEYSFLDWLKQQKIPLISGVDTRELTKHLRKSGVTLAAIAIGDQRPDKFLDPNLESLVAKVSIPFKEVSSRELIAKLSTPEKSMILSQFGETVQQSAEMAQKGDFAGLESLAMSSIGSKRVIVVDCGVKLNILRSLARFNFEIVRVPYDYDYTQEPFDGLFISNGPGDPQKCTKTIEILRRALQAEKPTFGICLGAQLLSLAIGASTYKLKFGHRGHNHPCFDVAQKKCILTAQNHGYAIEEESLPKDWKVTFRSLNDQSVEGIAHKTLPFFAVQFHPEASPGPTDAFYLFEQFNRYIQ